MCVVFVCCKQHVTHTMYAQMIHLRTRAMRTGTGTDPRVFLRSGLCMHGLGFTASMVHRGLDNIRLYPVLTVCMV